jgi:trehalose synthase-fused probable maltokinase
MRVKKQLAELFEGEACAELARMLPAYIAPRRWFRSKTRTIAEVSIAAALPLPLEGREVFFTVLRVRYAEGTDEEYVLPLTWVDDIAFVQAKPHLVVSMLRFDGVDEPRWLVDALGARAALQGILSLVARGATVQGPAGAFDFRTIAGASVCATGEPRPVDVEQSNTSVVFGRECILKVVRKLDPGRSPDLEMGEHLTRAGYAHTPRLLGAVELTRGDGEPATVAVIHAFVPNEGDAWSFTLARIRGAASPDVAFVRPLAERVAAMHAALAAPTEDPRFAPEPIDRAEREALGEAVEASLARAFALGGSRAGALPPAAASRLRAMARSGDALSAATAALVAAEPCSKTRVHGDLHLGQILVSGGDFVIIDFEGEPARSLAERKAKRSPAVDVAGMLRSLHYASAAAEVGGDWYRQAERAFVDAYVQAAAPCSVLPRSPEARGALLRFFSLEKCVYELHYELNNRPDWVDIPLRGLEMLFEEAHAH